LSDAIREEVYLLGGEFEVDDGEAESEAFEDAACGLQSLLAMVQI
jgi:hypothetical protein